MGTPTTDSSGSGSDEPEDWPFGEHPDDDDDRPDDTYRMKMAETPNAIESSDGKAAGRATFIR